MHINDRVARALLLRTVGRAHGGRCRGLLHSAAALWRNVCGSPIWRRPRAAAALLALAGCAAMAGTGMAGSPDVAAPLPLSAVPSPARPHVRPLLRDEEREAALQSSKRLRSMDAATVAVAARPPPPVAIGSPKTSDAVLPNTSANTSARTSKNTPGKAAVAADVPVYALATPITRTRIASELRQQLMGSSATVGELPGAPRSELMQVGDGWRAVVWPFATESDAAKARHLLAEHGIRTELLKF